MYCDKGVCETIARKVLSLAPYGLGGAVSMELMSIHKKTRRLPRGLQRTSPRLPKKGSTCLHYLAENEFQNGPKSVPTVVTNIIKT